MKRAYQKRAVQKSVESQQDQAVQICLPMAEVLTSLEQGLGELVRKVGRMFIESVLESEVEQIAVRGRAGRKGGRLTAGVLSKARASLMASGSRLRGHACVSVAARSCRWEPTSCSSR